MRFNKFTPLCSLLFAAVVLADPIRIHRRDQAAYSSLWAGAMLEENVGTFDSVAATFTVPKPKSGTADDSRALFAVAIDGPSCKGNSLRAGIYVDFFTDKEPVYNAFYDFSSWEPNFLPDLDIWAGDVMQLNVTATTPTSGVVTIENLTNGHHGQVTVSSDVPLCGSGAGWIAEVADQDGQFFAFAEFEDATFGKTVACGPGGRFTPAEATIGEIKQGDQTLTSVWADENSVTIHRQW